MAVNVLDPAHYMRAGTLQLTALPPLSIYVHLPWCLKKCPYCDFNSHEVRTASSTEGEQARYVQALLTDLESSLPLVWGRTVHSVFIGGGTPSLFSPELIDRLLAGIRSRVPLVTGAEITLEANPSSFERQRFANFRTAGVTRLSVGVQSFNDAHLERIGRVHDGAQARAALEEVAQNFETFNVDLMYALPHQTLAQLQEDVRTALSFQPPHLSIYHLTIEPNTFFAKFPPRLPDDDVAWGMLDCITEMTMQAGMQRYEVSAYAKGVANRCAHNLNYWQFGDYLGIGAGAHGKLSFAHRIVRQQRHRQPQLYMEKVLSGDAIAQEYEVSRSDLPFEFMLNALRLKDGFSLLDYFEKTGLPPSSIEDKLYQAEAKGWLKREGSWVRLTERGFDLLSDVQALFL